MMHPNLSIWMPKRAGCQTETYLRSLLGRSEVLRAEVAVVSRQILQ